MGVAIAPADLCKITTNQDPSILANCYVLHTIKRRIRDIWNKPSVDGAVGLQTGDICARNVPNSFKLATDENLVVRVNDDSLNVIISIEVKTFVGCPVRIESSKIL